MVCPSCKGAGQSSGIMCGPSGCRTGPLKCHTCKGSGEITEGHAARIEYGRLMRHDRVRRIMTVREEAARLGCDFAEWSRIEQGGEPETEEGRRALALRRGEQLTPPPEDTPDRHTFNSSEGWALCTRCGKARTADVHATPSETASV